MREISPLCPADDAFILDTSELGIDDVIEKASFFISSMSLLVSFINDV